MMNKYADIYVFQWGNEGRAGVPERRIRKRSGRGEEERFLYVLYFLQISSTGRGSARQLFR